MNHRIDPTSQIDRNDRTTPVQQAAVPFDWRFTRADPEQLLRRLDDHEQFPTAA